MWINWELLVIVLHILICSSGELVTPSRESEIIKDNSFDYKASIVKNGKLILFFENKL